MIDLELRRNILAADAYIDCEIIHDAVNAFFEISRIVVEIVTSFAISLGIGGRVCHLAKHAKKHRVRKKNRNRICRAIRKSKNGWQK